MLNISLDIDGVVSEYPEHFLEFLSIETGRTFQDLLACKRELGADLYENVKSKYRLSTFKYEIPLKQGMVELSQEIYSQGAKIFIHSSRPFKEYPNMQRSTSKWLLSSGFQFERVAEKNLKNIIESSCSVHVDDEIQEIKRLQANISAHIRWIHVTKESQEPVNTEVSVVKDVSALGRNLRQILMIDK